MIRARGAAAAMEQLDAIADAVTSGVAAAMTQEAGILAAEAKRHCPVETGKLRDSIHAEEHMQEACMEITVGSDLAYAASVELGTLQSPPRPYLAPALRVREDALTDSIKRAVRRAVQGE